MNLVRVTRFLLISLVSSSFPSFPGFCNKLSLPVSEKTDMGFPVSEFPGLCWFVQFPGARNRRKLISLFTDDYIPFRIFIMHCVMVFRLRGKRWRRWGWDMAVWLCSVRQWSCVMVCTIVDTSTRLFRTKISLNTLEEIEYTPFCCYFSTQPCFCASLCRGGCIVQKRHTADLYRHYLSFSCAVDRLFRESVPRRCKVVGMCNMPTCIWPWCGKVAEVSDLWLSHSELQVIFF
jgi:hypothetical protein